MARAVAWLRRSAITAAVAATLVAGCAFEHDPEPVRAIVTPLRGLVEALEAGDGEPSGDRAAVLATAVAQAVYELFDDARGTPPSSATEPTGAAFCAGGACSATDYTVNAPGLSFSGGPAVVVNASVGRTGDDVTLAFRYVGPAVSGTLEGTVALGPTSLLGSFEGTDDFVLDSHAWRMARMRVVFAVGLDGDCPTGGQVMGAVNRRDRFEESTETRTFGPFDACE